MTDERSNERTIPPDASGTDPASEDPQVTVAKINRSTAIAAAVITGVLTIAGGIVAAELSYHAGVKQGSQSAPAAANADSTLPASTAGESAVVPSSASAGAPTEVAPDSPPKIYGNGELKLYANSYYDLETSAFEGGSSDGQGDILQDTYSVTGADGAVLAAALPNGSDYLKCSALPRNAWQSSFSLTGARVGTEICVTTNEGRLGMMRVVSLPIPGEDGTSLVVQFEVWAK